MAFNSFLTDNDLLKEFVAYYYTDGSDEINYRNSYLFYPHVNTTLSFYRYAVALFNKSSAVIQYDDSVRHLKLVTQQSLPRRVTQIGKINKIAIVFKPLGLNRFVREKYSQLVPHEAQIFAPHNAGQWEEMLDRLYSENDNGKRTEILDDFLLSQYNGYENPVVEKSLEMLAKLDNELSIDEVAKAVNVSRKTLLRYFKSELRTTPELFRMITRFRHTLNEKVFNDSTDNLTQLAYKANFFDQAYFIKRFKHLTGVTPTQFFREGTRIGQGDTFWTYRKTDQ